MTKKLLATSLEMLLIVAMSESACACLSVAWEQSYYLKLFVMQYHYNIGLKLVWLVRHGQTIYSADLSRFPLYQHNSLGLIILWHKLFVSQGWQISVTWLWWCDCYQCLQSTFYNILAVPVAPGWSLKKLGSYVYRLCNPHGYCWGLCQLMSSDALVHW